MTKKRLLLTICLILVLASLTSCNLIIISQKNSDTNTNTNVINSNTNTDTVPDEPKEESQGYFLATVEPNKMVVSVPYIGEGGVPDEFKDLYYSALTPGGKPRNDGTGKIWLTLKPLENTYINEISIEGDYDSIEKISLDLYCISGVKSDLIISTHTTYMTSVSSDLVNDYGYGISDDGTLTLTWVEDESNPLRYMEISYTDENGYFLDYIDPSIGSFEIFKNMQENKIYTASMRAVCEKNLGNYINVKCSYMKAPKDVSFPRIEITTENLVWPSCDFVGSPEGCWGAGITNATYERCVVTLYNENNEVLYTCDENQTLGGDFGGAKLKIRGNTSARYASNSRFPYKLKLDKKYDLLFGLVDREEKQGYADRDWILLNYGNDGYRVCGDAIADAVGTAWSPDYAYVCLYVNGDYRGLYVLSEAVEEGNGTDEEQWRVNVDKDGFVFECDAYWWNEDLSFSTPLTDKTPMHFTFKYPDSDNLTSESPELNYLRDYLIEFEEALMKNDDSYLDYIDLDSFVRWLLVSDYLCINDGGGCNLFLYKKDSTSDSKICMGPNWDFDSYMGNTYGLSVIRMSWDTAPFYYQYLIKKDSFQKRYNELFAETYDKLIPAIEAEFAKIDIEAHSTLLLYDNMRFGTSTKSLTTRMTSFTSWLEEHVSWMETQFK